MSNKGLVAWGLFHLLVLLLTGCSGILEQADEGLLLEKKPRSPAEMTLAHIKPATLPVESELPNVPVEKLIASYINIMDEVENPELRLAISRRLADLGMLLGESKQLSAQAKAGNALDTSQMLSAEKLKGYFESAIASYRAILDKDPNNENNDQLLYQLAKAYDLESMQDESLAMLNRLAKEFPRSDYIVEVQFRRAEIFFSRGDYRRADRAYSYVVNRGEYTEYYQNALYMLGWTRFKRGQYDAALQQFALVLDQLMISQGYNELSRSKGEMLDDTLRVMSLAYFYLDGADSIAQLYDQVGEKDYEYLHYERLSELYLEKERYRDSADTYMAYINRHPLDRLSPAYHVKSIDALQRGNFPTLVRPAQEAYAHNYGVSSKYWYQAEEETRSNIRQRLKQYLPEFASFYHALAQSMYKKGEKISTLPNVLAIKRAYITAGDWYAKYIETFPEDKRVAEMHFLRAEALFEAEDYTGAVAAYETTAYQYPDYKKASEAAYSALLAYELHEKNIDEEHKKSWHRAKIISQLKFATTFGKDRRSPKVQLKAAQELYALQDYQTAIKAATRVTEWKPQVAAASRLSAWRVIAYSHFELKQYGGAEVGFKNLLTLIAKTDKEYSEIKEQIAASIYKQGEAYVESGNLEQAVSQFLRVVKEAPGSPIRISAQYDAATHLLTLKKWQQAADQLVRFRRVFPKHELVKTIPAKLVLAYQQLGQWGNEARELRTLSNSESDPTIRQNSLYLAAESYEKAGQIKQAIDAYRSYAHNYPEPFDRNLEAQLKLSELYKLTKDLNKRYFWLRKIVETHRKAAVKTDRSTTLAAMSSFELAIQHERAFARTKLKLPLKKSLQRKKKLLKRAIKAFTQAASYGVQEYTTASTYKIGGIYARLSRDLMNSQRPKNLDALELEQYEILLEEQAFPFEETAIQIHEENVRRSWAGVYDEWVKKSFKALSILLPARYAKDEIVNTINNEIY